jgi:hypothetical protein
MPAACRARARQLVFRRQVTTVGGRKARYRRGGFATREAAVIARQAILDSPPGQAAAGAWTLARWLRHWLRLTEPHLRPSTVLSYRDHIDRYLIPGLGRITLADLTGRRLQACFDLLARRRTHSGTLIAASTVGRVRATLRSALNAAVREGLISSNPLAHVRLARPARPYPVIWTDERVAAWRKDGIRPPVAVWTLRQLITFLTGVEHDRLAALWWLIALRGLRRGAGRRPAPRRPGLRGEGADHQPSARRLARRALLRAAQEPRQQPDHRPGRGRHPQTCRPGTPAER